MTLTHRVKEIFIRKQNHCIGFLLKIKSCEKDAASIR